MTASVPLEKSTNVRANSSLVWIRILRSPGVIESARRFLLAAAE